MHAYIDESGNSGANLFDPDQPIFMNLVMSSKQNFDDVYREQILHIAQLAGVDELHGNVLGISGVESLASNLVDLVNSSEVRFHFSCVEKSFAAAAKFYDAVFDPGENPAAPHHTYVVGDLRYFLLLRFASILTVQDAKLFWTAMISPPSNQGSANAVAAIRAVLQRVDQLPDQRSKDLIGDTLTWAQNNIENFTIWTPRKQDRYGHVPNIFTFPWLMSGVSESAKLWNTSVDKIVHDRQDQFGSTLNQWHMMVEKLPYETVFYFGDTPIRFPDIHESHFSTGDSRTSAGLQVVDVVLWTLSRVVNGASLGPNSKRLFDRCFTNTNGLIMTFPWIAAQVEESLKVVMNAPLTTAQLKAGKELMDHVEVLRRRRLEGRISG